MRSLLIFLLFPFLVFAQTPPPNRIVTGASEATIQTTSPPQGRIWVVGNHVDSLKFYVWMQGDNTTPASETVIIGPNGFRYKLANLAGAVNTAGVISSHSSLSGLSAGDDHPQYVNNARGDVRYVNETTITALREGSPASPVRITDAGREGDFVLRTGDTSTADDSVLVLKDASNKRYSRITRLNHYDVSWWGAVPGDNTDDTQAFQRAIDKAYANGVSTVKVPNGRYKITGIILMKPGITLAGESGAGEYFDNYTMSKGAMLLKDGGSAVPIVQMASQSTLDGLYLKSTATNTGTTGIIRMGATATSTIITQATVRNCYIFGYHSASISGTNTCYGIFFPESTTGAGGARYFNRIVGTTINRCDVGVRLSGQSNANEIDVQSINNYLHVELNGGSSEAIENTINIRAFNLTVFSPTAIVVKMLNNADGNNLHIISESYGKAFEVDSTSNNNDFYSKINEAVPSFVGTQNRDHNYSAPINIQQYQATYLPSRTSGDRYLFGRGAKAEIFREVNGTLPQLDNNAGTITASDADSRIIARFGADFFRKSQKPNFRLKLRVWANMPYGVGYQVAEVEMLYRCTNTSDGSATVSVLSSTKKGAQFTGLHFISSVSSPAKGFAIALTGGSYGAYNMDKVIVSMEIESLAFNSDEKAFVYFYDVAFVSEAVTSDDVTDAISLLATGDTNI